MADDAVVPARFRALVEDAVALVRDGASGALASNDRITFSGDDPLRWLREDEVELVALPDEAWASSSAGPVDGRPGTWWVRPGNQGAAGVPVQLVRVDAAKGPVALPCPAQGSNLVHCPSETTCTVPSTTLTALCSSRA